MTRTASHGRNLRALMRRRLPARLYRRLREVGSLADECGVSAFAVGGLVRDLLLGRGTLDVDIAVEGDGMAFARALADRHGAGLKTFERFATAYVVFPDRLKLDIATARAESYRHPTALPTVVPGSIKDDLLRRDFTINAVAIALNTRRFGELIDFYGGLRDLDGNTIRVLHRRSFIDDPTRVFRAVRFEQRFGFHLDPETLALLQDVAGSDLIDRLSGHRLLNEIIFLLSEKDPRRAVARLAELDLLRFIHPRLVWSRRLDSLLKAVGDSLAWHRVASLNWPENTEVLPWLVYLMALLGGLTRQAVGEVLKRLAVPERQAAKARAGHDAASGILRRLSRRPPLRPAEVSHLLRGLSDESLLLLRAKARSEAVRRHIAAQLSTYRYVKPSLTGADLKALGLKPGPLYKKILDRLLDARLNGEVKTAAEERELLKRLAQG